MTSDHSVDYLCWEDVVAVSTVRPAAHSMASGCHFSNVFVGLGEVRRAREALHISWRSAYFFLVLVLVFLVGSHAVEAEPVNKRTYRLPQQGGIKSKDSLPLPRTVPKLFPRRVHEYHDADDAFRKAWHGLQVNSSLKSGIATRIENYAVIVAARSSVIRFLMRIQPEVETLARQAEQRIEELIAQHLEELLEVVREKDALAEIERKLDELVPADGTACRNSVTWPSELPRDVKEGLIASFELACFEARPRKRRSHRKRLLKSLKQYIEAANYGIAELQRVIQAVPEQIGTSRSGMMLALEPLLGEAIRLNRKLKERDCQELEELCDIMNCPPRTVARCLL